MAIKHVFLGDFDAGAGAKVDVLPSCQRCLLCAFGILHDGAATPAGPAYVLAASPTRPSPPSEGAIMPTGLTSLGSLIAANSHAYNLRIFTESHPACA